MRPHAITCAGLTRLTLAFSKKRENFKAAVGLHFAYYNFVKRHNTLRCTPAMAAGVDAELLERRGSCRGGHMTDIEELREVIHKLHGVDRHIAKAFRSRKSSRKDIWEGIVEVFTFTAMTRRIRPMRGHMLPTTRSTPSAISPCFIFRLLYRRRQL